MHRSPTPYLIWPITLFTLKVDFHKTWNWEKFLIKKRLFFHFMLTLLRILRVYPLSSHYLTDPFSVTGHPVTKWVTWLLTESLSPCHYRKYVLWHFGQKRKRNQDMDLLAATFWCLQHWTIAVPSLWVCFDQGFDQNFS